MSIKPYYYIYICGLSFLAGVVLGRFINLNWLWFYGLAILGMIVFILSRRGKVGKILGLMIIFLSIGLWRWQVSWPIINQEHIAWYANKTVTVAAQVSQEAEQRNHYQQVTVKVRQVNDQPVAGKLLVFLPLYPEYHYGDNLRLIGEIARPRPYNDFSYDNYLARYNIYAISSYPQVQVVGRGDGNLVYGTLINIKRSLVNRVNRLLPEPESSFLGGLLWGAKRAMPEEVLANFNVTGTTHIVALSGYNITVLGLIIFFIAPWLGIKRQQAFWLVIAVILFFIIITGYSASVVRAGIMGLLVLIAYRWGGGSKAGILLVVSAALMCLINPKVLLYDVGFQLSFLATIGLIYLAPRIEPYLAWVPERWALRETIMATTAAIIMTAPLVIYQFGRLSLVALPANILILFVIPLTMAIGFIGIIVSFWFYALGQVITWLAYLPLTYVISLTGWLGDFSWASLDLVGTPWWLLLVLYMLIFVFIFKSYVKTAIKKFIT